MLANPRPFYPAEALAVGAPGAVVMGVIGTGGCIDQIRVLAGHPALTEAASNAIRRWRYEPTLLDGEAVEILGVFTVNFVLRQ